MSEEITIKVEDDGRCPSCVKLSWKWDEEGIGDTPFVKMEKCEYDEKKISTFEMAHKLISEQILQFPKPIKIEEEEQLTGQVNEIVSFFFFEFLFLIFIFKFSEFYSLPLFSPFLLPPFPSTIFLPNTSSTAANTTYAAAKSTVRCVSVSSAAVFATTSSATSTT
jgi:hypothetical protein